MKTRGRRPRTSRPLSSWLRAWARRTYEQTSQGVALVVGKPPVVAYANTAFRSLLGDGADVEGRPVTDIMGLEGWTPTAVCVCNRADGRDLQLCLTALPAREPAWLLLAQDTTEETRDRALLKSIIENIPDMIFVKDAKDLRFVLFNRAGEELLGYRRADMLGKSDYDFFPKSEADFFIKKDREVLASKGIVEILEEPIHTRRGERTLHTKKLAILDQAGHPRYLLGISENITDRKQAEEDLRELVYAAAHDLKAHLRRVAVFGDLLLVKEGPRLPAVADQVGRMVEASRQALALLDGLVRLGSLTRVELKLGRVDISAVTRRVIDELRRGEPKRRVEAVVPEGMAAYADSDLAELVLSSLLSNSWKFTAKHSTARIEVGCKPGPSGFLTFFVKDDGAGFDPACARGVFELFERQHREGQFPGAGIGLALAKRAVTRHSGTMRIESAVEKGTTVYFTLPQGPLSGTGCQESDP